MECVPHKGERHASGGIKNHHLVGFPSDGACIGDLEPEPVVIWGTVGSADMGNGEITRWGGGGGLCLLMVYGVEECFNARFVGSFSVSCLQVSGTVQGLAGVR